MQTMKARSSSLVLLALALLSPNFPLAAGEVVDAARSVPVAHEVDVVVVGGSSGGVAAAVEAAKNGAKVFLAAPRPYLGEDVCASYRLWLEAGEEPATDLAREVFRPAAATAAEAPIGPSLPFKYFADKSSAPLHKDTTPPSLLADGKWHSAPSQSVQYDGDVTLTLDLGKEVEVHKVHVLAYQRPGDFEVDRVVVSASADQASWTPQTVITNDQLGLRAAGSDFSPTLFTVVTA